ncbi:MAG: class I SAM-dependent methyltransferase [Treponema sp.]|nr:class I SAM-dependent methyltransferase [Treponema sp.]
MPNTIYESFKEDYLPYTNDSYKKIVDIIFSYIHEHETVRILELGCGSGAFTRFMANKNVNITAIDASINLINIAQQHMDNVNFIQGFISPGFLETLPLENFDLIVSFCFIHHLSSESIAELSSYLIKRMKKTAFLHVLNPIEIILRFCFNISLKQN